MSDRYYSKVTQTEVDESSSSTVRLGDGIIDWWFEPLKEGEAIIYDTTGMPYRYDYDKFITPVVDKNGTVVESQTQGEADAIALEKKKQKLRDEMDALVGDMTPAESMLLMLKYGFEKMNPNDDSSDDSSISLTPTGEDLIVWGDRVASGIEDTLIKLRKL